MKQKLKIFLFVWVLLMVFPVAWGVRINPKLDLWFNTVFSPEWVHITAHIILFTMIGILIPWIFFSQKNTSQAFWKTILIVLVIGLIQEIFQLSVKQRAFDFREVFDLFTDLSASSLGFGIYWFISRLVKKKPNK